MNLLLRALLPCTLLLPCPLYALDWSLSGFATLGYARSDQEYSYEGVINNDGGLERDSLAGLQLEAGLNPKWRATLQARFAPDSANPHYWHAQLSWAFLSWRPDNDWLLRAGKLRMPTYLFSENMDVGASYDVIRMPTEVYTTAPSTDYSGFSLSRSWNAWGAEWGLEAYLGRTKLSASTDDSGSRQFDLRTRTEGLVLNMRRQEHVFQIGLQQALITLGDDEPGEVANRGKVPGSGAGPGTGGGNRNGRKQIDTRILLLGVDLALSPDWRLVAEYAKRHALDSRLPHNSQGAYLTLQTRYQAWVPYMTVGRLLTAADSRHSGNYFDQSSLMLGSAYKLSPQQKLKVEWKRVRLGGNSFLLDGPTLQRSSAKQNLNIFSFSYNTNF